MPDTMDLFVTLLSLPSYICLFNLLKVLFFYRILLIQNLSFTTVFDGCCIVVDYIHKTSSIVPEITKQSMFDVGPCSPLSDIGHDPQ
jgi:hypothetical protein